MCPESECVLASSGKLHGWWGSFWKCVQRVSVASGKLHGWWDFFWKCVQRVSVFLLLLASLMAHEGPSENVSREWVCSGFFWQAGWLIRLLLKMCPGSECVLASSGKLHGSWGFCWKCVQYVSVFWLLLASHISIYLKIHLESVCFDPPQIDHWTSLLHSDSNFFLSMSLIQIRKLFCSLYVYF